MARQPLNLGVPSAGDNSDGAAAQRLLRFIERFEHVDEEIASLKDDRKGIATQAKSEGFDIRTINEILKLRKLSPEDRDEREALLDIYKGALGMLADTPLGAAAIKRLSPRPPPGDDDRDPGGHGGGEDQPDDIVDALSGTTIEQAHAMGAAAAAEGKPVTANPFPAGDRRRAAWDESWCHATGSDGMDLPKAWQRTPKKPASAPGAGDPPGDGK